MTTIAVGFAVIASLFGAAFVRRARQARGWNRAIQLATALLWIGAAVVELLVEARVLCDEECNIRVEVVLIPLVLLPPTLVALIAFRKDAPDIAA